MIITLYKNSQTSSDNNVIYSNIWQLYPYEPVSMFCEGKTIETCDYIIPDDFEIITVNGVKEIRKNKNVFEIINTNEDKPALRIAGATAVYSILYKPDETPPPVITTPPKRKSLYSFPDECFYNDDGTLSIW
jgi:hypothetical protein